MKNVTTFLTAAVLLVIAGCDQSDIRLLFDGTWTGRAMVQSDASSFVLEFDATLTQQDERLSGTSVIRVQGTTGVQTLSAPVQGRVDGRTVTLEVPDPSGSGLVFSFEGEARESTGRIEGTATYQPQEAGRAAVEFPFALARAS